MTATTREAILLAEELDQIREIYGSECSLFVRQALQKSDSNDWRIIVSGAVKLFEQRRTFYASAVELAS